MNTRRLETALGRRLGPMPAWAWAGLAFVVLYAVRQRGAVAAGRSSSSAIAEAYYALEPAAQDQYEPDAPALAALDATYYDPPAPFDSSLPGLAPPAPTIEPPLAGCPDGYEWDENLFACVRVDQGGGPGLLGPPILGGPPDPGAEYVWE